MSASASPRVTDRAHGPLRRLVRERLRRHSRLIAAIATAVAIAALVGYELREYGSAVGGWDLLFFSGCVTLLGALWLAEGQPKRFDAMLERLDQLDSPETPGTVDRRVQQSPRTAQTSRADAQTWEAATGASVALLVAGLFVAAGVGRDVSTAYVGLGAASGAVGGFLAGRVLGRFVCSSLVVRNLAGDGRRLRPVPAHHDGAAGLKAIGDYFISQAALLSIPAVFLAVWSLLFFDPKWDERYHAWRGSYLALFALSIIASAAAVVAPLWAVHVRMTEEKRRLLADADKNIAPEIARLRDQLQQDISKDEREARREWLADLKQSYIERETMPTWPLDPTHRRKLTIGNFAVVLPLLTRIVTFVNDS